MGDAVGTIAWARPTMRGFKISNADQTRQIRTQEAQRHALKKRLAARPEHVSIKELLEEARSYGWRE